LIALGVAPDYWIYISVIGILGLFIPMYNTPITVILQEKIEDDFRGRVFSVMGMISGSVTPLSMVIFGPLSDMISIKSILIVSGIGLVILTFFMMRSKVLLEAGKPLQSENT